MKLTLKEQIKGLLFIMQDLNDKEKYVHRDYITEKLERILQGSMCFHEGILEEIKEYRKSRRRKHESN